MQPLTQVMIQVFDGGRRLDVAAKGRLLKFWQIRCYLLFENVDDFAFYIFF